MPKITDAQYVTAANGTGYIIGYQDGVFCRWPVTMVVATKWHSGTGYPNVGIGNDGDYYLDTAANDVYQKSEGAWGGALVNIKGSDGNTWYFSSGTPSNDLGINGDGYLDETEFTIYKKVSGAWVSLGSVKGADGISPKEVYYSSTGTLAIRTGQLKRYIRDNHTIARVEILLGTAAGGSDILFDIKKNGVSHSIFNTDAVIPQGTLSATIDSFSNATLTAGDYLSVDITQIGSMVSGADLALTIILV